MCLPSLSGSAKRVRSRVKAGTHDVFIEKVPRRYPKGHPGYVTPTDSPLIPGQLIPMHIDPLTGKKKNPARRRNAWVVRRVDEHDRAHEKAELGARFVNGSWTPYDMAWGMQFRGGRFFDPHHVAPPDAGADLGAGGGV